jgi:hypothetical protein
MAPSDAQRRSPDRIPSDLCIREVGIRTDDRHAWANSVYERKSLTIERFQHRWTFPAFRRHHQSDAPLSCDALAEPATDAESAFDDSLDGNGLVIRSRAQPPVHHARMANGVASAKSVIEAPPTSISFRVFRKSMANFSSDSQLPKQAGRILRCSNAGKQPHKPRSVVRGWRGSAQSPRQGVRNVSAQ